MKGHMIPLFYLLVFKLLVGVGKQLEGLIGITETRMLSRRHLTPWGKQGDGTIILGSDLY